MEGDNHGDVYLQRGAIDAARFAEGKEAHVRQQKACCIDIVRNAKVAALLLADRTLPPGARPQAARKPLSELK